MGKLAAVAEWREMAMKALIGNIKITERIRKDVTNIAELAADIQSHGLINPVTVMSLDGGEFRLLAGLRRIRAVESLGLSEISINIVAPADAEAELRIEFSENEQREPFTFTEKMDFARMLEEVEKAKAQERMLSGKRVDDSDPVTHGTQGQGKSRDAIGEKIGMSGSSYSRAKYIAENASGEIIDELDKGQRSIRGTYDEMRAKEKAQQTESEDADASPEPETETEAKPKASKPSCKNKSSAVPNTAGLLSKADEAAAQRLKEFNAMSDAEKVTELQRQLKEERVRVANAESELTRLKELRQNEIYHKDGIIQNLQERLNTAEARVDELEALLP
jgi:ParB family chromosome partitioning protein